MLVNLILRKLLGTKTRPFSSTFASMLPVNLIVFFYFFKDLGQRYKIPHNSPQLFQKIFFFFLLITFFLFSRLVGNFSAKISFSMFLCHFLHFKGLIFHFQKIYSRIELLFTSFHNKINAKLTSNYMVINVRKKRTITTLMPVNTPLIAIN